MNDIQKELYDIFLETKRVCRILNIKLIAAGGTLLGAIRHKGFIPWDDDMDFVMLRDEYEIFCKYGPKLFNKKYFLQTSKTDHDFYYPFAKVRKNGTTMIEMAFKNSKMHQGMWIDIFPLDKITSNENKINLDRITGQTLMKRIRIHYSFQRIKELKNIFKIAKFIIYFYAYNYNEIIKNPFLNKTTKKMNDLAKKYNNDGGCTFVGVFFDIFFESKKLYRYPLNDFNEFIEAPFEQSKMLVIKNYENMLRILYGEWKILPPESKRVSVHKMFGISNSIDYKDYIHTKKSC